MRNKGHYTDGYIVCKGIMEFHDFMKSGKKLSEFLGWGEESLEFAELSKLDNELLDKMFWIIKPVASFLHRRILGHLIPVCEKYITQYEKQFGTSDYNNYRNSY